MVAFLVAVVRTPLTAIVLITEITGHFEVFYPSIVVGGLTYYFTELLQIKPYNVLLYDRMFRSHNPKSSEEAGARYHLFVEIMDGSYFLTERKWIHWLYLIIVSFVVYIGIVKTYFLRGKPWFPVIKWR